MTENPTPPSRNELNDNWLKLRNSELENSNRLLSDVIAELRRSQEEMRETIKNLKGSFNNE